jgi:VWFA-related protein
MSPGDRMAIVMLSGVSAELTDDPVRLRRTIDSYNVRASAFARLDVLSEQILDTLATVSREVREAAPGRKAIVAIGPGAIFDRPLPLPGMGRDLAPQWTDTMRSLAMAHAHLYVIDPSGVGATLADSGEHGFARETGGRAFLSTNDTTDAVDRILRDAANYYVIGVSDPPVGRKSELRKLDVRVSRRGVTVLARRAIPGGS